jgi:YidC/Oxa1 family membrane protein insertase
MNILYQILIAPLEAVMRLTLSAIYDGTGSYGVSIFFLSLLINVVLFPLFQMAERWQEAERQIQKVLKPKLQEFRQAFSGEERHAMIQCLYRQTGYHPVYAIRSSFGLFLQLPFWIAAYQLLSRHQPLNGASFLALEDLGKPDSLLWGFNLLPFVMTAMNLTAAYVYTKGLSPAQQIQPLVLASVFLVLLYSAPAGLLLYWTFNSLFSLLRIALFDGARTKALALGGLLLVIIPIDALACTGCG